MAVLQVQHLTHMYSGNTNICTDAIHDISFSAEKGEIIGIIGHTGSGKSTLVQHLNGLLRPTAGEIFVNGENIWSNPKEIRKIRSKVGLVFQYPEYQLFEETVYADIAFGPKNMGLSGETLKARVLSACDLVGIKREYLEKSPFDLSGGEKRRVAIAGVMAMQPQMIAFDEPTAGLDPVGRETVMKIIRDYRDTMGATVFVISHSMEDMALLADKLLVLQNGRVILFDTTEKVFQNGDRLREIGLNVPLVARVFDCLRKKGLAFPDNIFTVRRAVEALQEYRGAHHA